jgi:hypothetical protein
MIAAARGPRAGAAGSMLPPASAPSAGKWLSELVQTARGGMALGLASSALLFQAGGLRACPGGLLAVLRLPLPRLAEAELGECDSREDAASGGLCGPSAPCASGC